jgi:hypothetical protein
MSIFILDGFASRERYFISQPTQAILQLVPTFLFGCACVHSIDVFTIRNTIALPDTTYGCK